MKDEVIPPNASGEVTVFAFVDRNVRIIWITREGKTVQEQTVRLQPEGVPMKPRHRLFNFLKAAGHSAFRAGQILQELKRKDSYTQMWVRGILKYRHRHLKNALKKK